MPMERWMARAAGGTSQRLNPGPAMVRSLASRLGCLTSCSRDVPDGRARSLGAGASACARYLVRAIGPSIIWMSVHGRPVPTRQDRHGAVLHVRTDLRTDLGRPASPARLPAATSALLCSLREPIGRLREHLTSQPMPEWESSGGRGEGLPTLTTLI